RKPQIESCVDSMESSNCPVEPKKNPGKSGGELPGKSDGELLRSIADVDASPAEQSRIEGPRTRTDERQGGADGREEDAGQRILGVGEREPDPDRRGERAGDGRPQAGEQEATSDDRKHRGGHGVRRPAVQRGHRPTDERGSADEPQDGETHAWPAASERREEPAHNTPTPAYGSRLDARNPQKGRHRH